MSVWPVKKSYEIRAMSAEDFDPLLKKYSKIHFDDETQVSFALDTFNQDEKLQQERLKKNMGQPYELRLGVFHMDEFHGEEFVGWHFGRQESAQYFYMQNSLILSPHRRQGLYSALLQIVLETVLAQGFQTLRSRHRTTNNDVIIPKLKQGFMISALEVSDSLGTLVHLTYFASQARRKMMDYRVGHIKPDEEIRKNLGF